MSPAGPSFGDSFESLYVEHQPWLRVWLQRRLGNPCEAEDLTQDTFLALSCGRSKVTSIKQPRAYLRTIAHGLLVNHWRRKDIERACMETLAVLADECSMTQEEHLLLVEALQELDTLLMQLNPKARTAFLMSQLDGLTYAQIAVELQVSERMVKKYMAQAMLHCLQSDLKKELDELG